MLLQRLGDSLASDSLNVVWSIQPMDVFNLIHETWNDRRLSDFDLPRSLGYYATFALADAARNRHIDRLAENLSDDDKTTVDDYRIDRITVNTD